MVDIRQSIQYANYLKKESWIVERIGGVNYFLRKLPILGYVLKIQRPSKIDLDCIDVLIHRHKAFQTIVEPKDKNQADLLIQSGYKLSKSPYLPTKTLQIDLTKSRDFIFRHFKKDARSSIQKGSGLLIKSYPTPAEIKIFREAWKKSVNFRRFVPGEQSLINLRKSFPGNYSLFLASHNISGRIIGGALFTRSSHDIAYYWYGFTNKEGRSSLSQYSLLYQGVLWAKRMGCKVFDFEGIYDDRFPMKNWRGFTHFKRSFGGYEVEYPGCFTKTRLPI